MTRLIQSDGAGIDVVLISADIVSEFGGVGKFLNDGISACSASQTADPVVASGAIRVSGQDSFVEHVDKCFVAGVSVDELGGCEEFVRYASRGHASVLDKLCPVISFICGRCSSEGLLIEVGDEIKRACRDRESRSAITEDTAIVERIALALDAVACISFDDRYG